MDSTADAQKLIERVRRAARRMNAPDDSPQRLRPPPWSEEAEQSALGSILLDNAALAAVGEIVGADAFYSRAHRLIFAAISDLVADGSPADPITVFERLHQSFPDTEFGGMPYLVKLEQGVASARNARRYAEIVAEHYDQRMLISACDEASTLAWDSSVPQAQRAERVAEIFSRVERARSTPRRVPMLRLDELRTSWTSINWLVKRVIPADSIGMLFGGSGSFKSFVALDAALHVAHGLKWMGHRTRRAPVIFIAAEGGAGLWSRVEAWHRARGLRWQDAAFFVVPAAVDLQADAWRVVEAAQRLGVAPALVVVDTLSQTYAGEENSANEMAAYLRELGARFRQLWHCAILLIHHSGHQATERPRGSSAIRANVDFMLGLFRDEKEMLATLVCAKQKDGELFEDATFSMTAYEIGTDEDGDRVTSLVARHLSTSEEITDAVMVEAKAGRGGRNRLLVTLAQNGERESALHKAFNDACEIDNTETRRQAYHRALAWAKKTGFLEVSQGMVIVLKRID